MEEEIYNKLRAPFKPNYISWKINNYSSNGMKAMITFHVDARAVQHRLNQVFGVEGWSFTFTELQVDKGVHGKLAVKDICKEDVGYPNNSGKDEWYKDAVSDALKRCAVHFGVGHFLYALPSMWLDLKEQKQKFLTNEQNEQIKNWLVDQIKRMTAKNDKEDAEDKRNKVISKVPEKSDPIDITPLIEETKTSFTEEKEKAISKAIEDAKAIENGEQYKAKYEEHKEVIEEPEVKAAFKAKFNELKEKAEEQKAKEVEETLDSQFDNAIQDAEVVDHKEAEYLGPMQLKEIMNKCKTYDEAIKFGDDYKESLLKSGTATRLYETLLDKLLKKKGAQNG